MVTWLRVQAVQGGTARWDSVILRPGRQRLQAWGDTGAVDNINWVVTP